MPNAPATASLTTASTLMLPRERAPAMLGLVVGRRRRQQPRRHFRHRAGAARRRPRRRPSSSAHSAPPRRRHAFLGGVRLHQHVIGVVDALVAICRPQKCGHGAPVDAHPVALRRRRCQWPSRSSDTDENERGAIPQSPIFRLLLRPFPTLFYGYRLGRYPSFFDWKSPPVLADLGWRPGAHRVFRKMGELTILLSIY